MTRNLAYLGDGTAIHIPERQFDAETLHHAPLWVKALRGHAHVLAVCEDSGACVGWTLAETLGFDSVRSFMVAHPSGVAPS